MQVVRPMFSLLKFQSLNKHNCVEYALHLHPIFQTCVKTLVNEYQLVVSDFVQLAMPYDVL